LHQQLRRCVAVGVVVAVLVRSDHKRLEAGGDRGETAPGTGTPGAGSGTRPLSESRSALPNRAVEAQRTNAGRQTRGLTRHSLPLTVSERR
jgi:hypothetical protein